MPSTTTLKRGWSSWARATVIGPRSRRLRPKPENRISRNAGRAQLASRQLLPRQRTLLRLRAGHGEPDLYHAGAKALRREGAQQRRGVDILIRPRSGTT